MLNKEEQKQNQKIINKLISKMNDCNVCQYINITEKEQDEIYKRTGKKPNHICTKYNKRVFHECALSIKSEHYKLFPLKECEVFKIEGECYVK